jgi:hypothetical protein
MNAMSVTGFGDRSPARGSHGIVGMHARRRSTRRAPVRPNRRKLRPSVPNTSRYLSSSAKEHRQRYAAPRQAPRFFTSGSPPAKGYVPTRGAAHSARAFLERCGVRGGIDSGRRTKRRARRCAPHSCSRANAGGSLPGKSSGSEVAGDRDFAALDRPGGNQDEITLTSLQARWQHDLRL